MRLVFTLFTFALFFKPVGSVELLSAYWEPYNGVPTSAWSSAISQDSVYLCNAGVAGIYGFANLCFNTDAQMFATESDSVPLTFNWSRERDYSSCNVFDENCPFITNIEVSPEEEVFSSSNNSGNIVILKIDSLTDSGIGFTVKRNETQASLLSFFRKNITASFLAEWQDYRIDGKRLFPHEE